MLETKTTVYHDSLCLLIFEPRHEKTCLMPYANNKGADQLAQPRRLITTFVVCWLDRIISQVSIFAIS